MTENDYCLLYDIASKRITELEQENTELRDNYDQFKASAIPEIERLQKENAELKAKEKQIEKVEYTLKKIIETVHNDRIDYYGERLVLIYDFANECLQEIAE